MKMTLESAVRAVISAGVAGIGAAAGFTHTHDWAVVNGQHGWLAWADAVVIECMAVIAGFEIRRDHTLSRKVKRGRVSAPMAVLVAAFTVQMVAQVALAPRTAAGWLLAAVPALGFLIVVKLNMRPAPEVSASVPATTAEQLDTSTEVAQPPALSAVTEVEQQEVTPVPLAQVWPPR
jgi:hypothetical protein